MGGDGGRERDGRREGGKERGVWCGPWLPHRLCRVETGLERQVRVMEQARWRLWGALMLDVGCWGRRGCQPASAAMKITVH